MNEIRVNKQLVDEIVEFWKKTTGRAGPEKISFEFLPGYAGLFRPEGIKIHPWADDEVVFHELAHLEQWQDGRLIRGQDPEVFLFEGKRTDDFSWEESPMEIEACRVAKDRVEQFRLTQFVGEP